MPYYDDFKSPRFKSAEAIGVYADRIFKLECQKRGINPESALKAPLAVMAAEPSAESPTPTSPDDIVNLWYDGLTRTEIMALGVTRDQFVWAIRRARAVGDPRAYYRNNSKSPNARLPWLLPDIKRKRPKRRKRQAPQMPASTILDPEQQEIARARKQATVHARAKAHPWKYGPALRGEVGG